MPATLLLFSLLAACGNQGKETDMAAILEESLFRDILDCWYPRNMDTVHGGYISGFERDWSPSKQQQKSLVQQARHTWTTAFVAKHYPDRKEYTDYARQGYRFLADHLWDEAFGGFHTFSHADGTPVVEAGGGKLVYGQAFALYALAQYYSLTGEAEALDLARKAFLWMEEHAHDGRHGGYFEFLEQSGRVIGDPGEAFEPGIHEPGRGLKDYNSSIHILEGLTGLHRVWPDSLVRRRLEEMFLLIRDTFVHPDGYLQLYFYPDWTLVPNETMELRSKGQDYFTQHITFGHDVETAFLLLEAAGELGLEEDAHTRAIAKKLVDHSLATGWDGEKGGFFYMGRYRDGRVEIISRQKDFWVEAEGLNALLLMHRLYPGDGNDYYGKFLSTWRYIDNYLIDKEYGGWYSSGIDRSPESRDGQKSHGWKTTYHNTRALVHCIHMLRE